MPLSRRRVHPGCGVTAIWLVLASCASVTRTSSLESEPGRNWIEKSTGTNIVVESTGGVKTSGLLIDATADVVRLQGTDLAPVAIPIAPGANLRERMRGTGALLGALGGAGVGAFLGLVLARSIGGPNPDSAGGVEHPPDAVVVPLGALVGMAVGAAAGYAVGAERRLELRPAAPP